MKGKKRRILNFKKSPIVLAVLTVILFFVINATVKMYDKYTNTSTYVVKAEEDLVKLKEREVELTFQLEALNTEEGVEREVRETFGFVKDGEKVLVIVDEESKVEQVLPKPPGLWQKILSIFN